nr:immunoglobulin heavy chain junction region [Mus musculus]
CARIHDGYFWFAYW